MAEPGGSGAPAAMDAKADPAVLEGLAAEALSLKDPARALALIDRRLALPGRKSALAHLLRADALAGLGDRAGARTAILSAFEIDPIDPLVTRRVIAWGTPEEKEDAALCLIEGTPAEPGDLTLAATVLLKAGRTAHAYARIDDAVIEGFAFWQGQGPLEIVCRTEDQEATRTIPAETTAPLLAPPVASARFRVKRPPMGATHRVLLRAGGKELFTRRVAAPGAAPEPLPAPAAPPIDGVSIILPVYGDADATAACLDSLVRQLDDPAIVEVLIVDDASPDPGVRALALEAPYRHPKIRAARNKRNLGFASTVNRALRTIRAADVLLLNADTLVPPGFVARLRAAAHSNPKIGTVTPLSNNGELTSVPLPFRENPLPSLTEVDALDRSAQGANAGKTVELPNGVGFCLYVTRACLDAIGLMSEIFERGYYEDVDWCLRARAKGFVNVCATDVYVGHAGTRSFGPAKRRLVLRNLRLLKERYPEIERETAAFVREGRLPHYRASNASTT
jgi:GT2 family glycosyltransferase